ncbi:MAG: glutathione S-transferase family protein [Alphaproteobacteria bacterium]
MTIKSIKLWHYPATRSARAKWALHETWGDDFTVQPIALFEMAQLEPEYLAMNPNHNVPVLELTMEDGTHHTMLESAAMVEFLVDGFPDKNLAPPPGLGTARADYLHMLHFASTWMDMMLWQIRLQEHLLPEKLRDEKVIRYYREKFVREVEPQLLGRLENQPFICGEVFTGADIIMGHNVFWAQFYGLAKNDVCDAYLARLGERPAFQKAFADIGTERIT